ncbi:MAG: hypothetical protein UIC65_03970, partial [Alphaproteobacteria bacterium]|nr:hypothetical protein [Alphaproteobacteria bacterium]
LYAQWTQCAAGTFEQDGVCVTCPKGSYCAHGIKNKCSSGTYADKEGMTECTACPAGSNLYKGALYMVDGNYGATSIDSCRAISYYMPEYMVELLGFTVDEAKEQYGYDPNADANKRGVMFATCYYDVSTQQYTKNCIGFITMCSGGYYTNVQIDPESDGSTFETDTLSEMLDTYCMPVGTGYWSPELPHTDFDNLTEEEIAATWGRSACPTGLTTIGYGAGADEAGDCGRVLHVDGKKLYLRSTEKTDVSLHVKVDGVTFFGNMVVGDRKISAGADKTLKIKHNGQIYSVYDDSVN